MPPTMSIRFALSGSSDEMNYEFGFGVDIRFKSGGTIATKPALVALNEIANTVGSIIWEMEAEMSLLVPKA